MDSGNNIPKIWSQYMNTKDCSQGLCSIYCPQWCYIVFPPPPPPPPPFQDFSDVQASSPNFSPLVITIIVVLAGALLLVSYYTIISKYCRKMFSSTRNDRNNVAVEMGVEVIQEPWFVATNGLDEAVIKSIAMFEYKRGEGLVEGTECSVCLSEFVEEERLRLLPKCTHAFHVECIDTWLKCHSNCPLCRAGVAVSLPLNSEPLQESSDGEEESVEIEIIRDDEELEEMNGIEPKRRIRRSVSMDSVSIRQSCRSWEMMMKRSHSSGRLFCKYGRTQNSTIPL